MEVAACNEIRTGAATIRSTISGKEVREYSVEILKIYPEKRQEGRNMLIRVTDPALLQATGGIVQGMSGSPILQDGKLVGAVTHVLVNDPTTGYGIFIENMLDAAA
jgi:stage IV sporulation protein B